MRRTAFVLAFASIALVACGSSSQDVSGATSSATGDAASSTAVGGGSGTGMGTGTGTGTGGGTSAGGGGSSGTSGTGGAGGAPATFVVGGARPATVHTPMGYDGSPAALLVMLHGYSATGDLEEAYLGLGPTAGAEGFFYVAPSGTVDLQGEHFWNATDTCCNFDASTVDDDAYLTGLIDEIASKVTIDPKRVFFMGHSNGGFMSYRMACNHADKIAGIAVLAGEMVNDVTKCSPTKPVSVLHIQGTADATVPYNGGPVLAGFPPGPSAETSVEDWVGFDNCGAAGDKSSPPLDIEASLPGAETHVTKWSGCDAASAVELWTINQGSHIPSFQPAFKTDMFAWFTSHPRP